MEAFLVPDDLERQERVGLGRQPRSQKPSCFMLEWLQLIINNLIIMPHLVVVALYHLTERALAQHLQDLEAVGHVVVQHDLVVAAVVVEAVVVRVRRLPLPADAVPDVPYLGRQAGG